MLHHLKKMFLSSLIFTAFVSTTVFLGKYILFNMNSFSKASSTGKIFYVSNSGSNSSFGSADEPYQTISYAVNMAYPGDEIHILPGTYRENIVISNKNGSLTAPLTIVGESTDPGQYPVIDGGDSSFSSTSNVTKNPAFTVSNSSFVTFERLKVINSTDTSIRIDNSHFITVRRNVFDYHNSAVILKARSSHVLFEYNDTYQSYPIDSTWTQLKGSNWEGGAFKSDGGAGMNIIRYNYFHRQFNSIFLTSGYKTDGKYYDANVWIYKNRFEDVIDDPYEPETYAFNNHFFKNTLINTHRMTSFAPAVGALQGPIYVYNNVQIVTKDPTLEALNGRENSAFKIELDSIYYTNGIYLFNNSIDVSTSGTNGRGVDFLNSTVYNLNHFNNAYNTLNTTYDKSSLTLNNSSFSNNISNKSFGYNEPNSYPNTEPGFSSPSGEDLRLINNALAIGKSKEFQASIGFSNPLVILAGADLGAYQYGESDFRNTPDPSYSPPPGGEYSTFPANSDWPLDVRGGKNPLFGTVWQGTTVTQPLITQPPITIYPTLTTAPVSPTSVQSSPAPLPSPTTPVVDNTPPTLSIDNPVNNTTLSNKGSTKINVSASDLSGIQIIEISIDGNKVKTCLAVTNCQYNWSIGKVTNGDYTVSAMSIDNSTNKNSTSTFITVIKP